MRWLLGFVLLLLALGTLRVVGCGEEAEPPECLTDEDCDDENECTDDVCIVDWGCSFSASSTDWGDCDDGDDNECTYGGCDDGVCTTEHPYAGWLEDATPCESDGTPGTCWCGVCKVEPPECVGYGFDPSCDDGNECTEGDCECGLCEHIPLLAACDPCDRNGVPGVCILGVCEEPKCLTDEDCDDGPACTSECDDGIACTSDVCDPCRGCQNPVNCRDANGCTEDICDRDTGRCSYPPSPDGTHCGPCTAREPCGLLPASCCTDWHHCQNGKCSSLP